MSGATGTIAKFMIEGNSYSVAGDADFSEIITKFENSLIVTSGKSIIKQEKRSQDVSDVVLVTNGNDREQLRAFADSGDELSMSYTSRVGDVYRFTGTFNIDTNTTMESRTTLSVLPTEDRTPNLV